MFIKKPFFKKLPIIVMLIFAISVLAYSAKENYLLIKNGKLINLSGKDVANVLIKGEKIISVGKNVLKGVEDKDVTVIDAKGKYILPGLVDGFAAINNQSYANAYLLKGITSIIAVDGGRRGPFFGSADPSPSIFRLESVGDDKKSTDEHLKDLRILFKKGYKVVLLKYALTPGQVKACVKEAKKLGMATIGELGYTTYKEGCDFGIDAFVHTTRYSLDIASKKMALLVADHPFSDDLNSAKWRYYKFLSSLKPKDHSIVRHSKVLGNCSSFIMPTMSLSYLDTPNHKNPWNDPISSILEEKDINNPADKITGNHRYKNEIQDAYSSLIKNEKVIECVYRKAGAKYLAGSATDVWGTMPGISLHTELELLKSIGLSNRQVIRAATENFNRAFGWKIGKIEPSFRADLLILNSNPLKDLENLNDIHILIHNGRVIDRDLLKKKAVMRDGEVSESRDYDPLNYAKVRKLVLKNSTELKKDYEYLKKVFIKKIRYNSDGTAVTAYISFPRKRGRYPCIIYNRGGNREFGAITPLKTAVILAKVASWGYVVIGSQYRGNDGGEGVEEFGGKDVDDILNLIPVLESFVYADSKKIAMYGWSRGGMMTYLSLMRLKNVKAAVIGGGLADLKMMMKDRPDMEKYVYAELIPDYWNNRKNALSERSALENVSKLPKMTPILLLHGTADWRVKPEQSLLMAEEMIKNRIPFRLILFEGGDHGLTEFGKEVDNAVKDWFDRYLKKGEKLPKLKPHGK